MEQNPVVFDTSRPIAINLRAPGGVKTVRVRFPSDDEWVRRKVVIKQLGRGVSETIVANGEDVDAALVAKVRSDPAPEIDAFEAVKVVEQLSTAEVDDVVAEGDSFRITTRILGGTTVHVLNMPSAKDVFDYRRGFARVLDLPLSANRNSPSTSHQPARSMRSWLSRPWGMPAMFQSSTRRWQSRLPSTRWTTRSQRIATQISSRGVAGGSALPVPRALGHATRGTV